MGQVRRPGLASAGSEEEENARAATPLAMENDR